ncbi:MAG: right-handed parallel beta-helix repeat-containing protein, partial [Candidatus Heimdallarchaeota archaeon]|nr:right-handed parallel beta-helix repeat-containing protein [Candidatus Heimdallarchaeota archaeon]
NMVTHNQIHDNGFSAVAAQTLAATSDAINLDAAIAMGMFIDPSYRNTVSSNVIVNNSQIGVYLLYSDENVLTSNTISDNGIIGVMVQDSDSNIITDNDISNNGGVGTASFSFKSAQILSAELSPAIAMGMFIDPSFNNVVSGNTINDNGDMGLYLLDSENTEIDDNEISGNGANGVFLQNSHRNTLTNNNVSGNGPSTSVPLSVSPNGVALTPAIGMGMFIDPSVENVLINNTMNGNSQIGLYLQLSDYTQILGNQISNNGLNGVFIEDSDFNFLEGNVVKGNGIGVAALETNGLIPSNLELSPAIAMGMFIDPSFFNYVQGNEISENAGDGLYVVDSGSTTIQENIFNNNAGYGVNVNGGSEKSAVRANNFYSNNNGMSQASDNGYKNYFYYNYWSELNSTDENNDGVSEGTYYIDGSSGNADTLPLKYEFDGSFDYLFLPAGVDISPTTLDLKSGGQWVSVHIALPVGFSLMDINPASIILNGTLAPDRVEDLRKNDDVLLVKYDRLRLISWLYTQLNESSSVALEITGQMLDSPVKFKGYDIVEVTIKKDATTTLLAGSIATVLMPFSFRKKKKEINL